MIYVTLVISYPCMDFPSLQLVVHNLIENVQFLCLPKFVLTLSSNQIELKTDVGNFPALDG